MTVISKTALNFVASFLISFFILSDPQASATGMCGDEIVVDCNSTHAQIAINGAIVTVDCGPNTPSSQGVISDNHNCVGSAFACMKGKECVQADPLSKTGMVFHMPNCGTGGQPQGTLLGAGCIHVDQATLDKLKTCVGTKYKVIARENHRTGR